MTFLDGSEVSYLQTDPISEDIPYAVDRDIFVELYYIFVARAHRRKLNALKISLCDKPVELHMRRRHTELVCCLSRVRKRAIHDGLEDNRRVSCAAAEPSSLRHTSQYVRHQ